MPVAFRGATAVAVVLVAAGCDPILNVQGSFFPAWMASMVIGIALTVAARYLFVGLRVEPDLGPPVLIYTSLGLLLTLLTWLVLYRA
jgi:hypothetical protein